MGDRTLPVRQVLGELGDYLEANDPLHIPRMARRDAEAKYPQRRVSYGSVRKDQAKIFQDTSSLVIEVVRPGVEPKNSFDQYDKSLVHVTLINDFDPDDIEGSSSRLEKEVSSKLAVHFG